MGFGDYETPYEELRAIFEASDDLAARIRSLSKSIHFFACGIQKKIMKPLKPMSLYGCTKCAGTFQTTSIP